MKKRWDNGMEGRGIMGRWTGGAQETKTLCGSLSVWRT